ncbi:hypothetical protein C1645_816414 [Glomus cerebriforme]|uniref:Uncharacterized protein n=1 Tax=Glomus cerebriforme TaxID=658196 RepID=A0A397TGP1_9GLOM|nr:hypothetical protein C1645_816414 [Glomus cerebriforme]
MNSNNYSQNNFSNNIYESNFTEVINGFNNSDNFSQTSAIQAGPSSQNDDVMNDMYTPITYNNNANISDHYYQQPISTIPNDTSYDNVTVSNDVSSYNPYQQLISNDASYNNYAMPNNVSYNNNITISQNNDQHPPPSNNIPSFNSLNITINSPQNISEIFRYGFKIIIMPATNSDVQDQPQQDYTYLDRSSDNSQIQFQQ